MFIKLLEYLENLDLVEEPGYQEKINLWDVSYNLAEHLTNYPVKAKEYVNNFDSVELLSLSSYNDTGNEYFMLNSIQFIKDAVFLRENINTVDLRSMKFNNIVQEFVVEILYHLSRAENYLIHYGTRSNRKAEEMYYYYGMTLVGSMNSLNLIANKVNHDKYSDYNDFERLDETISIFEENEGLVESFETLSKEDVVVIKKIYREMISGIVSDYIEDAELESKIENILIHLRSIDYELDIEGVPFLS